MDGGGLLGAEADYGDKGGAQPIAATAVPVGASGDPEVQGTPEGGASEAEQFQSIVWAESVRPAVLSTPTSACSINMVLAVFLQAAFATAVVLMLTDPNVYGDSDAGTGYAPSPPSPPDYPPSPPGYPPSPPSPPSPNDGPAGMSHTQENNAGIWVGVILLLMLIEVCACPSASFLRNMLQDGSAYQHVEGVRKAPPSVNWHIQCYHYHTVHYTETHTDSEGRKSTQHKTRRERRNTYSASMTYSPYYWEDISSPFPDIGTASLTRLTFDKQFCFADAASAQDFRDSKRQFIRMNRRDVHYDFSEVFQVPGFEGHVLACKDESAVPGWLNQWMFYLASAFCLTVPYRMAFAKLCWEVPEYRYIKRFYSRPVQPMVQLIFCPVPVLTTCVMPVAHAVPIGAPTPIPMAAAAAVVAAPIAAAAVPVASAPLAMPAASSPAYASAPPVAAVMN